MSDTDENVIPAVKKTVNIEASVRQSNEMLRKLAASIVAQNEPQKKTAFNLAAMKKEAAGLAVETYPLFDRSKPQVDMRTHQLITERDIIERNRSYGLRPEHVLSRMGIDYDRMWQTYMMDKFYSEYQDKDGNWVGGYIQKRFEVDKNIPATNNMQLKPGELRKPYLPEYGSTEARLETSRGGKVFNWHEANSAGVVKTAEDSKKKRLS